MSEAIIAVGGTGKRAAALYLKLMNTLRPDNMVRPGSNVFVIDMEPEPGTTDDDLNRELKSEGVPPSHFVSPVLEDAQVEPAITLSRFMNFETANANTLPLAHALFNTTQLNVQIIKGMNCEPTVGATVAARKFRISEVQQEEEVQSLQDAIAGFSRVIVVGSIVGGTGAGVTPQLVKWIRDHLSSMKVYGLLFMRWIDLPQTDQDGPTNVKMSGNAKAWLNYLIEHHPDNPDGERRELFTHYVLVGAPQDMVLNKTDTKSHHPLHLLGAYYLLQFDNFQQIAPGATGPHYFELSEGIKPQDVKMGDATMAAAIVWEKLFVYMLGVFKEQRPDEALSPFTLMFSNKLAWPPFIKTMEAFAAKWNRRGQLRKDWGKIADIFEQERSRSEARIEDLKKLTSTMPGADEIFDFDWNDLFQRYETKKPDALALTRRNLQEVPVAFTDADGELKSVAWKFIGQLRTILRKYIKLN